MTNQAEVSRRHFLRMAASAGIGIATIPVSGSLLAACGGLGGRDTLKIGVLAPFSGTGSFVGSVVNSSLEAAVKQVNDKGGLGGRKVELLLRDTGDDATAGVREYNQLTGRANVTAILWCGAAGFNLALPEIKRDALPVIAVYEDAFSGGFLYPQGQATGRSVFQMQLPDAYAKAVLGNYAKDDRGYTSAALFYDRVLDPGGVTKQQFEKAFGGEGMTLTVETFVVSDTDYSPQLQRLSGAKPQLVYLEGLPKNTAAIVKQLAAMGASYIDTPSAKGVEWHPQVFGSWLATGNTSWAERAGEAAAVGTVSASHLAGVIGAPTLAVGAWMRTFLGRQPAGGEEGPADALAAIVNGIKKAGTTDRAKLVRGMEEMRQVEFASLPFGFTRDRHVAKTMDDTVITTLERLRGPALTEPSYQLGREWQEGGSFAAVAAAPSHLVRPTLEANRRSHPETISRLVNEGYGTQCTKHGDGSLGNECKIH